MSSRLLGLYSGKTAVPAADRNATYLSPPSAVADICR